MKFLKISLAASVAIGATASFAQPLEEAIKGVDVSGFLRYRYTDDRYDNANHTQDNLGSSNALHQWRAQADFKTPTINNIALNLGIGYHNPSQNVNHGKYGTQNGVDNKGNPTYDGTNGLGGGLGAGQDSKFGVTQFYMTITPDSTATTILLGKQRLGTPVTDALDDRATGILALNSDIPGLTLAAGAFDSWSLDDLGLTALGTEGSVDKPLYTIAAIYNTDTGIGNIGAQVWGFMVDDLVDTLIYSELSWKHSLLNANLQYGYASLSDDPTDLTYNLASDNDLLNLKVGANFKQDFGIPLDMKVGYVTNFQDGTTVAFDDEGNYSSVYAGQIWFDTNAVGATIGLGQNLNGIKKTSRQEETDLNVFYGALKYGFLDDRLTIGLEGVYGEIEKTAKEAFATYAAGATTWKKKFTEITPTFAWQHNKNLRISGYYAILNTQDDLTPNRPDEDRNRARVEVKYSF